jgi:hypothetical protein
VTTTEGDPVAHARATDLTELPEKMQKLPVYKGIPIPYFVHIDDDGKPDHRIVDARKYKPCLAYRLCWVCGQPLGAYESYAIGPMCTINRISGEPGQHTDCSNWSAMHCPFLTTPGRQRRETRLPEDVRKDSMMVPTNPGVMAVWTTKKRPTVLRTPDGAPVFRLGAPTKVEWFTQGRQATHDEALAAFELGVERLKHLAGEGVAQDEDYAFIEEQVVVARAFLP